MRKVLGLVLVLSLAVVACGDDDGGTAADPASASSCEELADVGIDAVQEVIDEIGSMSIDDFIAASSSDEPPESIARLEAMGLEMETRAQELGCSETDSQMLMCDRIDRLQADSEVGRMLIASISGVCEG